MSVRTRAADPGLSDRRAAAFTPYVRAGDDLAELTPLAIALGIVLSLTFGMVNAYLGLKIGLTVSASIPSAVLSMTVLRGILRRGTVLENNVVHAIASTGESLAAGVIFTIPALIFLDQHPSALEVFLIAVGAGTLGILLMIPFRHDLTVEEHATLPFPEGTACARVLMAGDRGGVTARPVFAGIALGALYQLAMRGFSLWRESVSVTLHRFHKATFGMELSPLFLGVGFLIGPRIAGTMLAGGVLGWTVLLPWFDKIGGSGVGAMLGIPETVRQLGANDIWSRYVRYVGAGAVAAGGISAVVRALPVMLAAFTRLRPANRIAASALPRTERDLPTSIVAAGVAILTLAFWLLPAFHLSLAATVLAVAFSFFFVVVSGRIVGLVGTTSQPVSGMTITALLGTTLVLAALGERGAAGITACITVGALVAISIALAGDLAQDLKTGALLGATPYRLQIGQMIGVTAAALRAGSVLLLLHAAYGLGSPALPAPQAKLMATLVTGVMDGNLPWTLMALGAGLALTAELCGLIPLAFAIGLYLPITTTAPLILGGLLRAFLSREATPLDDRPVLFASGLIAGDALMGIGIAALTVGGVTSALALRAPGTAGEATEAALTILPFASLAVVLARYARGAERQN
ncbi:MAG: oligopeptide transporter, OPT family [Polyangiaceae bacterium UTPRO1]|jgi:putative OPT family oligopeptide transporter|nr:oligopeptide transporter, OPT family [Myxococcales bacterium]OQY67458.1 MAG: oligopeptide transporter, OPT family [Polyangiaceae bacterium UTPRO1]